MIRRLWWRTRLALVREVYRLAAAAHMPSDPICARATRHAAGLQRGVECQPCARQRQGERLWDGLEELFPAHPLDGDLRDPESRARCCKACRQAIFRAPRIDPDHLIELAPSMCPPGLVALEQTLQTRRDSERGRV